MRPENLLPSSPARSLQVTERDSAVRAGRRRCRARMLFSFILSKVLPQKYALTLSMMLSVLAAFLLGYFVFLFFLEKPCLDDAEKSCHIDGIEALYFTVVTISTVGYGDYSPVKNTALRTFTVFYIILGCGFVFVQMAQLLESRLRQFSNFCKHLLDRFDTTASAIDTTGDGIAETAISGRKVGLSGKEVDITGDGQTDFIMPPHALIFWTQASRHWPRMATDGDGWR